MTSSMIATAAAAPGAPLGAVLRKAREDAGFSAEEAATRLQCSRAKISRIENGHVQHINPRDAFDLLRLYGWAPEAASRATGYELHSDQDLLDVYDPAITPLLRPYLEYELRAAHIETFHPDVLPGLLQTSAYTQALSRLVAERRLHLNIDVVLQYQRQQRFFRNAPVLDVVVSEVALMRRLLPDADAREQMAKILEVADHPQVTLQVLPLSAEVVPGVERTFSVFTMPQADPLGPVACVHTLNQTTYHTEAEECRRYRRLFAEVCRAALDPAESLALVRQMGARLLPAR